MNEDNLIEERKKKLIKLLKNNPFFSIFFWLGILTLLFSIFVKAGIGFPFIEGIYNTAPAHLWFLLSIALFISCSFIAYKKEKYSFYPLFAWIVYFAVWIRSVNISKLRDVTTGGWTLGPDLDPFLFLRWAEYIVEHGKLMMIDTMRYIPQFFNTRGELILLPYMIAWFHKIAAIFGSESVVQSAALFPVFMFGLTALIFFLLSREIFIDKLGRLKAELIAFFSTFLMIVSPSLFPRTIAGIPEKESAGFFFLFLTFYIFLKAWKSRGKYKPYILSLLAGLSTSAMALIWGGFIYIYAILGLTFLISFFLGKIGREEIIKYSIWLISASSSTTTRRRIRRPS